MGKAYKANTGEAAQMHVNIYLWMCVCVGVLICSDMPALLLK